MATRSMKTIIHPKPETLNDAESDDVVRVVVRGFFEIRLWLHDHKDSHDHIMPFKGPSAQ